MIKAKNMFVIGLLVLFFAATCSAIAAPLSSLNNTTWTGDVTSITTTGVKTPPRNAFSISFKTESTDLDFLSGTFTVGTGTPVPFSAIRDGHSLSIVAAGLIIHGEIILSETVARGGERVMPPTARTMLIKGKNLTDGSQFEGTLVKQ